MGRYRKTASCDQETTLQGDKDSERISTSKRMHILTQAKCLELSVWSMELGAVPSPNQHGYKF